MSNVNEVQLRRRVHDYLINSYIDYVEAKEHIRDQINRTSGLPVGRQPLLINHPNQLLPESVCMEVALNGKEFSYLTIKLVAVYLYASTILLACRRN